jgi:hypothetical protein
MRRAVVIAALAGATFAVPATAPAAPNVAAGCSTGNLAVAAPSASCRFEAADSLGVSSYTDTGWTITHKELVPALDANGCAQAGPDGKLLTETKTVDDAEGGSGPTAEMMSFTPGTIYTVTVLGNGWISAGHPEPAANPSADDPPDTPVDRTQGVSPGDCF